MGLSNYRRNFLLSCYLRPALRRAVEGEVEGVQRAFRRLVQRLRPFPGPARDRQVQALQAACPAGR